MHLSTDEALECASILWSNALKRPLSGISEAVSAMCFVHGLAQLVHAETTPETFAAFRAWLENGESRSLRALIRTQA